MRKAEGIEQRAEGNTAGSIVISYSLFGSSVAMSCLEDSYDLNGSNDLTNQRFDQLTI